MKTYFTIISGKLTASSAKDAVVQVYTVVDEEEKNEIHEKIGIDSYDLDAALDPDEISRIEFKSRKLLVIWKQPHQETDQTTEFDVSSVGLFLDENKLTIIMKGSRIPFSRKEFQSVNSLNDVLLKYFFYTTHQYLDHLKAMKKTTSELQSEISSSMGNKAFLQMFTLSESLVYYLNAIEANGAVLSKLHDHSEKHEFSLRQRAFLEDIILENKQCARQAQIYSTVLSGLMDARGTIINNNMNILLKNLTLINVVFLPLTLIASMGGMSEFTWMVGEYHIDWRIGYFLFSAAMIGIAWITWKSLKRYLEQSNGHGLTGGTIEK